MKTKITKDSIPSDFTLALSLFDGLPVIFFCLTMIIISVNFESILFLIGSLLMLFAGICKVLWKIIVVLKKKNIWFLFVQMRITMPIGFFLIILSIILNNEKINMTSLLNQVLSFPSIIFFITGTSLMVMMLIFGIVLDGNKAKNNWIEQITNLVAQLSFFIGTLLVVIK